MDLAELISTHKRDRTYRELERDSDGQLCAQRWQQLATRHPRGFPSAATLATIAAALAVPEETVLLAAGVSLGLHTRRTSRLVDLIPDRAADLPDQAVNAILGVIRAMINAYEGVIL